MLTACPNPRMPVIAYQSPAKNPLGLFPVRLDYDPLRSLVVRLRTKQRQPGRRPFQDVVNQTPGRYRGAPAGCIAFG